nr:hypothetical protein [Marinicella sp. W31]MDC2877346.1 hypothetical protein [Marinicella sp. W31]
MIDDVENELHFTPRQQVVLEQALRLLVEGGEKSVTTAESRARRAVQRKASTNGSVIVTACFPP